MGGYNLDDDKLALDEENLQDVADTIAVPPRAGVPAPVVPVTASPYDSDFRKYWMNQAKQGLGSATATNKVPEKISTAPEWYKAEKPPGGNDWAKALLGMAGNMISGPAQVSMQNPLRPLGMKQEDAKQVALGQGLGALLGGLAGGKKTQYDNELDAAKKQASMTHIAPGGTSAGMNQANLSARMLGLANQSDAQASLEAQRKLAAEREAALHNPDSPELAAAKNLLVQKGLATAEELQGQTLATLQKQYPLINTTETEAGRNARDAAKAENERSAIAARANAQGELANQKQRNEDTQNLARADLGHGMTWRGGIPPDEATQREARKQIGVRNYAFDALDRMKDIQAEMNEMSHGFSGTFDEWMGTLIGTPEARHAQDLVTEAEQIQGNLKIQERIRANMGVPQPWEDKLVTAMNPRAGSLTGWLKGRSSWESMKNELDKFTRASLDAHGVVPTKEGQAAPARPQYEEKQRPVAPVARVKNKQVVQDEEMPSIPAGDSLPVAPVPPAPKMSGGGKRAYVITPRGGGKPFIRELTDAEVQMKKQAAGDRFDIRPQ